MSQTDRSSFYSVLDQFGAENTDGIFENVIVGEVPHRRAALALARKYATAHPEATVIIVRERSVEFEDLTHFVYTDDFGCVITEANR
jgi:hypothetical protein